mmetsp:Transcript_13598/g.19450  ORF Transcript_13598/g.19450 Transcript_13598/m.19450 type:complete len:279 (+) Transcript_13598:65-901(+)
MEISRLKNSKCTIYDKRQYVRQNGDRVTFTRKDDHCHRSRRVLPLVILNLSVTILLTFIMTLRVPTSIAFSFSSLPVLEVKSCSLRGISWSNNNKIQKDGMICVKSLSQDKRRMSSILSSNANSQYDNTNDDGNEVTVSSSMMIRNNDVDSLLASAFLALDEEEKYDAVLTGLCAKVLDNDDEGNKKKKDDEKDNSIAEEVGRKAILSPSEAAYEKLRDPIQLLSEMNERNILASGRSLMAIVDVSTSMFENAFYLACLDMKTICFLISFNYLKLCCM